MFQKIFKKYEDKNPAILWHWWYFFDKNLRNNNHLAKHLFKDCYSKDIPQKFQIYIVDIKGNLFYKKPRYRIPKKIKKDLDDFVLNWRQKRHCFF